MLPETLERVSPASGGANAFETVEIRRQERYPSVRHALATPDSQGPPVLLDLETALAWTLQSNPGLVTIRQSVCVSAEAVEVARRFPTSLNPTLSVQSNPWVYQHEPGGGVERLDSYLTVNWFQPIELGDRRELRSRMAQASFSQARWNVLQAELSTLVQTYRAHQTATYRRERLAAAQRLLEFNARMLESLHRQMEANQVAAADVVLAEVESQATLQQLEVARQEYAAAVADLRGQIGLPQVATSIEPAGELRIPAADLAGDPDALVRMALEGRPDLQAAQTQVCNSRAAVDLARADRIPVFSLGPAYEHNETGANFYGLALTTPVPILNAGNSLVRQREAELHRDCVALEQQQQQVAAQVRAALVKWNEVRDSAIRTLARSEPIREQALRMQRLYEAGQADLVKLLQVRQRLIEADFARLDALWQTTQAYADLLSVLGATPLLGALANGPETSPPANGQ
jgi:cobalt-zinc-cadmium efflux system outer membrane protein